MLTPLRPEGAVPVLTTADGMVVGVRNAVGSGAAWLIGTILGFRGLADRSLEGHAAIRRLLAATGVQPAHDGRLVLRRRAHGAQQAWCFYNPTSEDIEEPIRLPAGGQVVDLLEGPITDRSRLRVRALDVRLLVVAA